MCGMGKGFRVMGSMCKAWARTAETVGKRGIGRTSLRNLLRSVKVRFWRKVVMVVSIEAGIRKVVCGPRVVKISVMVLLVYIVERDLLF